MAFRQDRCGLERGEAIKEIDPRPKAVRVKAMRAQQHCERQPDALIIIDNVDEVALRQAQTPSCQGRTLKVAQHWS